MQRTQTLNLGPASAEKVHPEDTRAEGELTPMADLLEQTRTEVRRTRMQLERQQEQHESHERRTNLLSVVLGVLIVLLAGAVWLAYPALRDQKKGVAEMLGLQNVSAVLGGRVNSLEAKLNTTSAGLPGLGQRIDQLQGTIKSNLQLARNQAQAAATEVGGRIRQDVNQSVQLIQSRLAGLESNQREASERVTQLQERVAGLQREMASMREEASAATERIKGLQDQQQTSNSELSGLGQRMASNQISLDALANRVERKRVDFEVPTRRTKEIIPGISLTVRRTDVKKQEIDGLIGADSRNLPVRGQGLQKPMVFYTAADNRPVELVLTEVTKNAVSGYLVMPAPLTAAPN